MAKDWVAELGECIDDETRAKQEAAWEAASSTGIAGSLTTSAYNVQDIVSGCKNSLNFLAAVTLPTVFSCAFPPVLLAAWQLLTQVSFKYKDFSKIALGIPRGHGKTTLVKLFVLFLILFTKRRFILIVGSTATLSENILGDICSFLNEPNIKAVFGDWKLGVVMNRTDQKIFAYRGRKIILAAVGQGGSLRGINIDNQRPDTIIFEDIQTREDAESKLVSDGIETWMLGTAMKAKSPHGCLFIFCGNMYPGTNSILKKLKNQKSWIKFISGAILADGTALWEDLRSKKDLLEELDGDIEAGHPEIFFSEVLNDTEAGVNNRVDFAKIRKWPWGPSELPQGKFILVDPSLGIGKDDTAIGYIEVYDGTPGLRRIAELQLSPGNIVRTAILWALTHGCRAIIFESTGFQASLLYWCEVISTELGITGLQYLPVQGGMNSKNMRISTGLKCLTAGEIDVHDDVRPALTVQIANWNPLKRDNSDGILDIVAYMPKIVEMYGNEIMTFSHLDLIEAQAAQVQESNHVF